MYQSSIVLQHFNISPFLHLTSEAKLQNITEHFMSYKRATPKQEKCPSWVPSSKCELF